MTISRQTLQDIQDRIRRYRNDPELTKEVAEAVDAATEETVEALRRLDALTPHQKAQLRLPLRSGGLGLREQASLPGVAYLGSWLGNLEGVRGRCPPGVASQARFTAGDRAWARALTDARTTLAAEGIHLSEQGEVLTELPQASWDWGEDCAEVPQVQRALPKALDEKRRARLLSNLAPEEPRLGALLRGHGGRGLAQHGPRHRGREVL